MSLFLNPIARSRIAVISFSVFLIFHTCSSSSYTVTCELYPYVNPDRCNMVNHFQHPHLASCMCILMKYWLCSWLILYHDQLTIHLIMGMFPHIDHMYSRREVRKLLYNNSDRSGDSLIAI